MNDVSKPWGEREQRAFKAGLDQYFSAYDTSQALALELIERREHPMDVLVLLCARLDALASDARGDDVPHRQAFCGFLTDYAGERDLFDAVSVPNLYYEIGYYRWRLDGTIPAPGRLHRFAKLDDPLLHLIEDSGLPITMNEIGRLLDTLSRILQQNFHAKARQSLSKPRTVSINRLTSLIEAAARKSRLHRIAERLPKALLPLLNSVRTSNIMYEHFRCESIHGATVHIDSKRFFSESHVYWRRIYPIYLGNSYELIEFPAKFLLSCLQACIKAYRAHLMARRKVPHAIYFQGFDDVDLWSTLDFLDYATIPDGGLVPLKFDRR